MDEDAGSASPTANCGPGSKAGATSPATCGASSAHGSARRSPARSPSTTSPRSRTTSSRASSAFLGRNARHMRRAASALFNWAAEAGRDYVTASPCINLPKLDEEHPRDRVLTEDEIRTLWHGLDRDDLPWDRKTRLAIKFALVTMLRSGELLQHPPRRTERRRQRPARRHPGKRVKKRRVINQPLSDLAVEIINEAMGNYDYRVRRPLRRCAAGAQGDGDRAARHKQGGKTKSASANCSASRRSRRTICAARRRRCAASSVCRRPVSRCASTISRTRTRTASRCQRSRARSTTSPRKLGSRRSARCSMRGLSNCGGSSALVSCLPVVRRLRRSARSGAARGLINAKLRWPTSNLKPNGGD